jgi:two-component system, cell cycle response regulator CpdR
VHSKHGEQIEHLATAMIVPKRKVLMGVHPRTALVVEDDMLQREAASKLLQASGMEVINCESAEAAELLIGRIGPELSLLVTDVSLGGVENGVELVEFARHRLPDLRIVVLSGQLGLELPGKVSFLRKPYAPEELGRISAV